MINYLSKTAKNKLKGTVLLRLDFNTEDEWRMEATLPTIRFLLKQCEKIVIVSHRGRPTSVKTTAGKPIGKDVSKLSLKKDGENLGKFLKRKVVFIPHFRFREIQKTVEAAPKGSIFLLENLRFLPGEEKNDTKLAKSLASLADYYVNDAFPVSHRANTSTEAITKFLPSYAGLELESEMKHLAHVMGKPKKPLVVIFGGGKAHEKIPVIRYFRKKADMFILGGSVANTLLKERGVDIDSSKVDENPGPLVHTIAGYRNLLLPIDFKMSNRRILDIGVKTEELFAREIKKARTIIWNGPLGLIEEKKFSHGSLALTKSIGRNKKAFRLIGGGETVMFIKKHKMEKAFSFISTGGGAMLEFLSGKKLPGIEALKRK